MFNFGLARDSSGAGTSKPREEECKDSTPSPIPALECIPVLRQIPILPCHRETASRIAPSVFHIPGSGTKLYYVGAQQIHKMVGEVNSAGRSGTELKSLLSLSDSHHSDLIPGVYEGGLKVWECALDLVHFLSELDLNFPQMNILELGCGIGLPGIYSAMRGAKAVHFQDYNPEVLNYSTIPSVMLNTGSNIGNESKHNTGNEGAVAADENGNGDVLDPVENVTEERFKFYSGDWNEFVSALEPTDRYDLILTSETIYSLDSQPKLLSVLKQVSTASTGVVYVAAKTFYFGVGGGVDSFRQLVQGDGTFTVSQCRKIHSSVPRVILKLTHKKL